MRILLLSTILTYFFTPVLLAQIVQPERLEIELGNNDEFFEIYSAGEDGIFIYRDTKDREDGGLLWEVSLYNTDFELVWTKLFKVEYGFEVIGHDYNNGRLFLLFSKGGTEKGDLKVFRVMAADGSVSAHEINRPIPIVLTHFESIDDILLFAGKTKYKTNAALYNLKEKRFIALQGLYTENSDLLEIQRNFSMGVFQLTFLERKPRVNQFISVKSYDLQGTLLFDTELTPGTEHNFIDGTSTSFLNDEPFIIGTWSNNKSQYSRGMFFGELSPNPGEEDKVKFYSYVDFQNFFSYLKDSKEKRIRERIIRKKNKGKKPKFNYRLLIHDVIKRDNNYIVVGEVFYPTYIRQDYMPRSGYYPPSTFDYYPGTGQIISEFNFSHAVILSFDENGQMLWDNSFEIDEIKTSFLEHQVSIDVNPDRIALLYFYEGKIKSQIIKGDQVIEDKTDTEIKLKEDGDELKDGYYEFGKLEKWYGKYFFAYGLQRIKNNSDQSGSSRKVFYINKIYYED
ncbi:hypothetical protein [Marinigracilibium pacificum]|uniref:ELWxxDGT repeat protein n=1 Tax=Marinigracilibium pacificum TaxID=2729599 RepID=A0A848J547_9BACT|nr:hypothetical protein [Marinigracilibium pacificum]NMM49479.1 hypothetical protein [Marinigracilibium pacificum]